jgi:hypothetical protein
MAERQPLHWRTSTAPLSPDFLAEGRPLHSRAAATGRPQGSNNLRKALCQLGGFPNLGGVSSHLCVPSGFVPGGAEVDSGEIQRGDGGAGPDRFCILFQGPLCNLCGPVCNFPVLLGLICNLYLTADNMKP